MRGTPIASPGLLGELFWLLSHPACVTLSASTLGVALLAGVGFESVWTQALALFTTCAGLAQLTTQTTAVKRGLIPWVAGAILLLIGVGTQISASGHVTLPEGARVEAYERGEDVKVEHHLGATLSLKRAQGTEGDTLAFDLGGTQQQEISERALLDGELLSIGPWNLSFEELQRDSQSPRALLKVTPRSGGETRSLWVRTGDRVSPDGQLSVTAFDITGNYNSPKIKDLGAAVDLELSWRAQAGAGEVSKERAWHFTDVPQLNKEAGVSPWVVQVERVEASPVYVLRMSSRASMTWIWLGLCLWAVSLLLDMKRSVSAPLSSV